MKIGFIGLGKLGLPLAVNAARGGFTVKGFDICENRMRLFERKGGAAAGSVAEAAGFGDFVITVLPDAPDVEAVALGLGGIMQSMVPNSIYIDMSTIDPLSTRRIGSAFVKRGIEMVDAPVARTLEAAWQGKSLLMLGGNPGAIERAQPLFDAVSEVAIHCGPPGHGSAAKLFNNYLANGLLAVAVEALGIGMKSGLSLETVLEVVERTGTFNKMMLETLPAHAFRGDFAPGFRCVLARKDQRLALEVAASLGVSAPVGRAVLRVLSEVAESYPDLDLSAVLKHREETAGFSARLADSG